MKTTTLKKMMKTIKKKKIPWGSLASSPWFIGTSAAGLAGVGGYYAYRYLRARKPMMAALAAGNADVTAKIQKVMSKSPRVCLPSDTILEAAKLMKQEDVGFIPIIDDPQNRHLVGIVTDRDIVLQIAAGNPDVRNTKLETLMSKEPVICHETDRLEKALTAMSEHQIKRIPVVDKKERLVGVVSQRDLARSVKEPSVTGEVVKEITH